MKKTIKIIAVFLILIGMVNSVFATTTNIEEQTKIIANELKSYGFNLNFAPCIDVNTNPNNPIIGDRAFSDKPDNVIVGGKIVVDTYKKNGITPCLKHYPGHGDANTDSHLELPKIDISLEEMEQTHIKPFAELAKFADMIMVAHLHCTCFEKEAIPTSLSKNSIDYLRNKLHFDGIIISDDMIMKGVEKYTKAQAIEMGIKAGLNMFIYRNSDPDTMNAIEEVLEKAKTDKLLAQNIETSYEKIMRLKSQIC